MKIKELASWMTTALKNDAIKGVGVDVAEICIDEFFDNKGLIADIPVIGIIFGIYQAGVSIKDRIFVGKLLAFVIKLSELELQDRLDMVERLENEPEYANKVGERIIEMLDRVDSYKKPKMVAVVFSAYARKEIDYETLCRLNGAIDKLPLYDMKYLRQFINASPDERSKMSDVILNGFLMAGLVGAASAWGGLVYSPTSLCDTFIRLNIDQQ